MIHQTKNKLLMLKINYFNLQFSQKNNKKVPSDWLFKGPVFWAISYNYIPKLHLNKVYIRDIYKCIYCTCLVHQLLASKVYFVLLHRIKDKTNFVFSTEDMYANTEEDCSFLYNNNPTMPLLLMFIYIYSIKISSFFKINVDKHIFKIKKGFV